MSYRNGNYSAFYVAEPFSESNLGAHSARDFIYYNLLRAWKGRDSAFPFVDSHEKNYSVRDSSDWEKTLKPRIHGRLGMSKNIILFLSSHTKSSRALREEIRYGITVKGLPIIVVYPDRCEESSIIWCATKKLRQGVRDLWEKLPEFKKAITEVPTLHIPNKKSVIQKALLDRRFMVNSKTKPGVYYYRCQASQPPIK